VLHIAVFITLCECFLGVAPSWALWKAIFMVRPNRGGGRTYPVGGCGIQVRGDTRYFRLKTVDSAQGWRKGWFYASSQQEGVANFSTAAFVKTKAWDHQLSSKEMAEAAPLMTRVDGLLDKVTGIQLIAMFVKRRVWPIRARAHAMWEYEGAGDATRMSPEELSRSEVVAHVRSITNLKADDPCQIDTSVDPYGLENPLPEVCMFLKFARILRVATRMLLRLQI
jgi:Putative gypsy type transposon